MNPNDDIVYAAGLFDGEGCISLLNVKNGRMPYPQVLITTTDPELAEWLKQRFGGVVSKRIRKKKQHHKTSFNWRLDARKALEFIAMIRPYIQIHRRQRKIDLLLRDYLDCTPRNGKYSPEMRQKKMQLFQAFQKLCYNDTQ